MAHPQSREEAVSASFVGRWIAGPLAWAGGAISAALILATFAVTIHAIVMRYLANDPLLWADEVTGWSLVAIVMLGAAEAYRRGDHIAIDVLSSRTGGVARETIGFASDAAVLGFAAVVGMSTWEAIRFARMFGSYTSGHIVIETWILQLPIVIGCGLMALTALVRLGERALGLRRG